MSIAMNRFESYMFNLTGDNSDQSPSDSFCSPSSSASSSIGMNSDKSSEGGGEDVGENEVESPYKGPLDMMESLEQVLPVRKGISKYYNGKSKSFTNLGEEAAKMLTSSTSMKDLAKPENPYSRRRRNLLCHQIWENSKTTPRGGITKKPIMSSSRSALPLAMAVAAGVMTGEGPFSSGDSSSSGSSPTTSGSPPRQRHSHHQVMMMRPPLYPRSQGSFGNLTSSSQSGFCAWKSYSVADMRCFPATASGIESNES